jgi:hypothetical protein
MEINKMAMGILVAIVVLITIVTVIGSTATTVNTAADGITQDARCTATGCFWNESRTVDCTAANVTTGDTTPCGTATSNGAYPLEGLFNTGGLVTLLFIAVGLLLTLGVAWKMYKK